MRKKLPLIWQAVQFHAPVFGTVVPVRKVSFPDLFLVIVFWHQAIGFGDISKWHRQVIARIQNFYATVINLHDLQPILYDGGGAALLSDP